MKDKEEDLENLSQQSLPLPKDEEEIEEQYEEKIENEEDNITSKDEKDDEEGRMIDIPFNLFG